MKVITPPRSLRLALLLELSTLEVKYEHILDFVPKRRLERNVRGVFLHVVVPVRCVFECDHIRVLQKRRDTIQQARVSKAEELVTRGRRTSMLFPAFSVDMFGPPSIERMYFRPPGRRHVSFSARNAVATSAFSAGGVAGAYWNITTCTMLPLLLGQPSWNASPRNDLNARTGLTGGHRRRYVHWTHDGKREQEECREPGRQERELHPEWRTRVFADDEGHGAQRVGRKDVEVWKNSKRRAMLKWTCEWTPGDGVQSAVRPGSEKGASCVGGKRWIRQAVYDMCIAS